VLARIRLAIDDWKTAPAPGRTGETLKLRVAHEIAPYLGALASRRIVTGVADTGENLLSTVEPVLALFLGSRAAARLVGTLTLPSGLYYLKGGTLSLQNGTIQGTGVTIFLTGAVSSISINGNMVVNLSAPTTGTYDGLVIFQDRNLASPPNHTLNGGSLMNFTGSIYLPGSYVKYAGGNATVVTALIANTIEFTGATNFGVDTTGSITGIPKETAFLIE